MKQKHEIVQFLTWNIGNVTITSIVEIECGNVIQEVIPNATKENITKIPWLVPHFADKAGNLKAVVQSFVVKTSDKVILVDACVGNDKKRVDITAWNNLQTDFLQRLEEAGCKPEDITHVLCTHLHFDHVGWNTKFESDKWVPTFPKAKYLFAEKEFEYWKTMPEKEIADDKAGFVDSVLPIIEAGLHELIPVDYKLCDGVSLISTPGHTPAHCSVLISSKGKHAVITGDVLHHPCQIAHPEWETISDTDPKQAVETRKKFLERFADSKTLVIGSHFAEPAGGSAFYEGKELKFQ